MPQDSEFSDYEPVIPSKKRAELTEEEWLRSRANESEASDFASPFSDDSETLSLSTPQQQSSAHKQKSNRGEGLRKVTQADGHALTYIALFLFTVVLFFRPYELFLPLSGLTSMAFWLGILTLGIFVPSQLAMAGTLTERPREVNLVLLLCLMALLSIPFAISPSEAWLTFNDTFIRAVLIFIVIINAVRTERRLYGLLFLSIAVACLLSVVAIGDFRAGNLALQGRRISGVVGGMFGNPNDLALHLVTMFPLIISMSLSSRNVLIKVGYGLSALLIVAGIVATFSRGGFLGLVGAALLLTWKLGRRQRFATMSTAIVITVGFIVLAPGGYLDRILSIFGLRPDPLGSAGARENLLTHSLYTAIRHPMGVGMGNYHIVAAQEAVSHNAYTQVASELGIIALVIYVLFLLEPLKRLRSIEQAALNKEEAKRYYYLAIGLQASLVGYMISSFFASVAYQWYVFYLVGYAICLHRLYAAMLGLPQTSAEKSCSQKSSALEAADT